MAAYRHNVIVIGGGPAGLTAAGQAALGGAGVILLEKKESPAKKLRIAGNGRCNITNGAPLDEFLSHFGRNGKFLRAAFSAFFSAELIRFLSGIGLKTVTDKNGRVYPESGDANDVADAMLAWIRKSNVQIVVNSRVEKIIISENRVRGVRLAGKEKIISADSIIIATGGASYPGTGSSGDGYRLAGELGHSIVPIRPASVPLDTSRDLAHSLQGLSLQDIGIKISAGGKRVLSARGDLLFTHFGISGPLILSISRACVDLLRAGHKIMLTLDFAPDADDMALDKALLSAFEHKGKAQVKTILKEYIPQRMAAVLLASVDVDQEKWCSSVTSEERRRIRGALEAYEIEIIGHRPLAEAMVTAGGVSLKEVDPQTMASRLVKGLYLAGEVLDLDADTGGYNLQAAFSTGFLAGKMSARNSTGR